jgi:hypothetical protein
VCQAVRAPGVKWTLAAARRDGGEGAATVSMKTAPVNQSLGPGMVSRELRVICMISLSGSGQSTLYTRDPGDLRGAESLIDVVALAPAN